MADVEILRGVLKQIARDNEYTDSEKHMKEIVTGGAHYTSKLFITTLSVPNKEQLHLFSKLASLGEKMRSKTAKSVFEVEIMFYTKILPKYRELEESYNIPVEERLILPEYYGGSTEYMKEVLVLEDLSVKGYKSMDRFEVFDWEYASKCLSVIARFHALSVAFETHEPVRFSSLVDHLNFEYPTNQDFLEKGVQTAIDTTDAKYRASVEKILQEDLRSKNFWKFSHPERRPVLCHGDFRPSNILHKTTEDGTLHLALVDFQIIRRWNPASELMFFLVCGSDQQFRSDHLQQFFDHYYQEFTTALRKFRIDPLGVYPEKDYREDVKQMLAVGLTLGMYCLPFITVEVEDALKPEDCTDMETYELRIGKRFRGRFNGLVGTYREIGVLSANNSQGEHLAD